SSHIDKRLTRQTLSAAIRRVKIQNSVAVFYDLAALNGGNRRRVDLIIGGTHAASPIIFYSSRRTFNHVLGCISSLNGRTEQRTLLSLIHVIENVRATNTAIRIVSNYELQRQVNRYPPARAQLYRPWIRRVWLGTASVTAGDRRVEHEGGRLSLSLS
ncbi:hypothetical protein BC830DRAFT_1259666, partial [Chytriomyces sp. MP71]